MDSIFANMALSFAFITKLGFECLGKCGLCLGAPLGGLTNPGGMGWPRGIQYFIYMFFIIIYICQLRILKRIAVGCFRQWGASVHIYRTSALRSFRVRILDSACSYAADTCTEEKATHADPSVDPSAGPQVSPKPSKRAVQHSSSSSPTNQPLAFKNRSFLIKKIRKFFCLRFLIVLLHAFF